MHQLSSKMVNQTVEKSQTEKLVEEIVTMRCQELLATLSVNKPKRSITESNADFLFQNAPSRFLSWYQSRGLACNFRLHQEIKDNQILFSFSVFPAKYGNFHSFFQPANWCNTYSLCNNKCSSSGIKSFPTNQIRQD